MVNNTDDASSVNDTKSRGQGFASMSEEKKREVSSKGGRTQGKDNNSGNFANDKKKAERAGEIGGSH